MELKTVRDLKANPYERFVTFYANPREPDEAAFARLLGEWGHLYECDDCEGEGLSCLTCEGDGIRALRDGRWVNPFDATPKGNDMPSDEVTDRLSAFDRMRVGILTDKDGTGASVVMHCLMIDGLHASAYFKFEYVDRDQLEALHAAIGQHLQDRDMGKRETLNPTEGGQ